MKPFKNAQQGTNQIKQAEKPEEVINYGLWRLGRRDHSISELREKLGRKTDNPEWIEHTINYLISLNYLNERRYVENFIKNCNEAKHYGPSRIRHELRLKGLDKELVNTVMAESEFDYLEETLLCLNKKCREPIEDRKERDRLTRYLLSRGFSFDMIRYAFEEHLKEPE